MGDPPNEFTFSSSLCGSLPFEAPIRKNVSYKMLKLEVLFTIFVPALFLTGTHATLQACGPGSGSGMCHKGCTFSC